MLHSCTINDAIHSLLLDRQIEKIWRRVVLDLILHIFAFYSEIDDKGIQVVAGQCLGLAVTLGGWRNQIAIYELDRPILE